MIRTERAMPASLRLQPLPTTAELRAVFDAVEPFTVGIEEEAMLLDPATLDLAPRAEDMLARLDGDARFTRELPASQVEIATTPTADVADALAQLAAARARLIAACEGIARPAAAGVHPFAELSGELNEGGRYELIREAYGPVARRQLVAALQVHVAVGGADRTLAVHDALRSFLPELAALSANSAFHGGRDSGLASARPLVCGLLPRQGVPPALGSWERVAAELAWGARAGTVPEPRLWWWELRPHPTWGTLELRVPDAQTTLVEAAGVVVVAQALVAWLAQRFDAGEPLPVAPGWRIEENRFSALRHGLDGELADLESGERMGTRARLLALLDALTPVAERLGAGALLPHAHALVERNGATRQRAVAAERGVRGLAAWMAERYGDPLPAPAAATAPAGAAAGPTGATAASAPRAALRSGVTRVPRKP
jgi:carboxylate-amine ligase